MEYKIDGFISITVNNGILIGVFEENVKIELEDAKKIVKLRLQAQNYESLPVLIDVTGVIKTYKKARDYLGNK